MNRLFYLALLLLLAVGCSESIPEFSTEAPYTVEVKRVRDQQTAESIAARLRDMKVPAYASLLRDTTEIEDNWYLVLAGATPDSAKAAQLLQEWSTLHKLEGLTVQHYDKLEGIVESLATASKADKVANIETERPEVNGEHVYDLLAKFPSDDWFEVQKITLYNLDTSIMPRGAFRQLYDTKLDLPRGIHRRMVADHAMAFAEVILEDNLYGDRVTIDVLRLRETPPARTEPKAVLTAQKPDTSLRSPEEMAWYYAAAILNTGQYDTETHDAITVKSFAPLTGYKVVIEPKPDYFRTYWVLIDEAAEYLLLMQSTAKTDEEMLLLAAQIGKGNGVMDYNEFHNNFYALPHCLDSSDVFIAFESEILTHEYARNRKNRNWARAMVGHAAASASYYNHRSRENWSSSVFDVITRRKVDDIYNVMYRNDRGGKDEIDVNGQAGFYLTSFWGGYAEVNFPSPGRHIVAVGGDMTRQQLLDRANRMQVGGMSASACQ